MSRFSDNVHSPYLVFAKSRGGTIGTDTVVQDGDSLGRITFFGNDGTDGNTPAAEIDVEVDGTPGSNDMPGRIVFRTTADGGSSVGSVMTLNSDRFVGIGTETPSKKLHVFEGGLVLQQYNLKTGDSRGQAFNILSTNGANNNTGTLSIRNEAGQSFIDFSHNEGSQLLLKFIILVLNNSHLILTD